jgi:hypothetical protein
LFDEICSLPSIICLRRSGRVVPVLLRVHPRVKAILIALMRRD